MGAITQMTSYGTDKKSYSCADSGCAVASEYLGEQSKCQECPFPQCVLEGKNKQSPLTEKRYAEIVKLYQEGKEMTEKMEMLGISKRTIHRALRRATVR